MARRSFITHTTVFTDHARLTPPYSGPGAKEQPLWRKYCSVYTQFEGEHLWKEVQEALTSEIKARKDKGEESPTFEEAVARLVHNKYLKLTIAGVECFYTDLCMRSGDDCTYSKPVAVELDKMLEPPSVDLVSLKWYLDFYPAQKDGKYPAGVTLKMDAALFTDSLQRSV